MRTFWDKFFRAFLAFYLVLNLVFFNSVPVFAEEASSTPETVIITGDATSENNIENEANTSVLSSNSPSEEATSTPELLDVEADNTSEAEVFNSATSTAETGENNATSTENSALVVTGDANASANVVNLVNTNIVESNGFFALLNVFASLFGNVDLRSAYSAAPCFDPCSLLSGHLSVFNQNTATITNDILVRAHTGANTASAGADGAILTGEANAAANVLNIANTNIVGSNYLFLVFNNFGDWDGSLIFPSKYDLFKNCCVSGGNVSVENENSALIENNASSTAETGGNTASSTDGIIATGNANSATNVVNQVNTNIFGSDSVFIVLRFFGDWAGSIFSAPQGLFWIETPGGLMILGGAGSSKESEGNSEFDVSNLNSASILNNVNVFALTGENQVSASGDGLIGTGDANAAVNIVNVANTNVIGRNWVLALVNIFGNWRGNVSFGEPDLWVGESVSNVPHETKPGSRITYTLTVINNGDTDATNVVLYDDFEESFLNMDNTGGGVLSENGGGIQWILGTLKPGETRIVSYDASFNDNLPVGTTMISNTANASSFEPDGNNSDNIERTSIMVTRAPTHVPNAVNNPLPDFQITKTHSATSTLVAPGGSVDYKIVLKNNGSGKGYEAKITDNFYYATSTEPLETRAWNLDTVFGEEEITITYTLEISPDAAPGIYRNVAKFSAKDELVVDRYFVETESYIEVMAASSPEESILPVGTGGIGEGGAAETETGAEGVVSKETSENNELALLSETAEILSEGAKAAQEAFSPVQLFEPEEPQKKSGSFSNLAALLYSNLRLVWPWLLISILALLIAFLARRQEEGN